MTVLRAALALFLLSLPAAAKDVEVLAGGSWKTRKTRTVSELRGFAPKAPDALNAFGGWSKRAGSGKSGFFKRRKLGGRWWLIDPEGRRFLSMGVNSVNRRDVDPKRIRARFPNDAAWAKGTAELLRANGFNTLGCWSDYPTFLKDEASRLPYTARWNFMSTYKDERPKRNGPRGYPKQTIPVFDPEFPAFCQERAKRLAKRRDDPWLLGHFSDNELPFRPNALDNYLALGKADPGRKAAEAWWKRRQGGRTRAITTADRDAFLEVVARRYYSVVARAIKKHDPNHLYLGSRIHGRTIRLPLFRAARGHVDVMSINYYHRWSAETARMNRWVEAFDGPFLISEWYAQSVKSAKTPATGAGFRVQHNAARGRFYQNLALGLLEHPGCVGWHWFKYGGDGEGFRKGIVDRSGKPHVELLKRMRALNANAYSLSVFLRRR